MISTDFNYEPYEGRRVESAKAEGLRFVPEGTGPKVYSVVCANASDWNEIHGYIINENEIDGIPNRKIECTNLEKTFDRIGSYEMSDAEAEQLRNHSKIIGVNIDEGYYEGTYKGRDTYVMTDPVHKTSRYSYTVPIGRYLSNTLFDSSLVNEKSKTAAQLYRHQTLANPWQNRHQTLADGVIYDIPESYGDGTDVDVIVSDSAGWLGHVEFVKTGIGEPDNFVGTNVLKNGFATSATTGVCGVLDLILSAPYYIDPDFFEASPSSRLRTRWDGTTLPVESVARSWWQNENTSSRSAKYVGTTSGGTATVGSKEDFGTIAVSNNYTEATHNGSDTSVSRRCELHTGQYDGSLASHGTPCMSQAYGKTHGWAYNSNKWFISYAWASGSPSADVLYQLLKVFHELKPNRTSDNTKNPTIASNSWGSTASFFDGYYSFFRTTGDGTGEEDVVITQSTGQINLAWLNNFDDNRAQWTVDGVLYAARGYHTYWVPPSNATMAKGAAMLDSGVIWCGSAGNNNNKQVKGDHPDYNNYVSFQSIRTLGYAEQYAYYELANRVSNPNCIGCVSDYNGTGVDVYRTFNIGALNDNQNYTGGSPTYQENKAWYSNMGNAVDCYTIGDASIGAKGGGTMTGYSRYESSYRLDSNYNIVTSGGTASLTSQDRYFNGTSSACPVATGLIATKLQYNRDATWIDLKDWLANDVTNQPGASYFYQGTEATTSNDSNWNSTANLQGSEPKILWDARMVGNVNYTVSGPLNVTGPLNMTT